MPALLRLTPKDGRRREFKKAGSLVGTSALCELQAIVSKLHKPLYDKGLVTKSYTGLWNYDAHVTVKRKADIEAVVKYINKHHPYLNVEVF